MNTLCAKLGILTAVAALVTGLSISVNAAEKKSFKWTHTARETVSETKSTPVADHEFVQGAYIDPIKTKSPEFDIIEARITNQDYTLSGDGRHRGVEIDIFNNGGTAINKYEGTQRLTPRRGEPGKSTMRGSSSLLAVRAVSKTLKVTVPTEVLLLPRA
jgi:hypothetical protein